MRLVFHGGKCCGIKTIMDMGYSDVDPYNGWGYGTGKEALTKSQPALTKRGKLDHDSCGQHVNSELDFFTDDAPAETALERFDRLIAFCRRRRPSGIIEIALMTPDEDEAPEDVYTQAHWFPILEERGFVKTVEALNSNSGNTVHVFHLAYSPEAKKKVKKPSPLGA